MERLAQVGVKDVMCQYPALFFWTITLLVDKIFQLAISVMRVENCFY